MKIQFIIAICCTLLLASCEHYPMHSPSKNLSATIYTNENGCLYWQVKFNGKTICQPSALGLVIDGEETYKCVKINLIDSREINETYPTRGSHSVAHNHAIEYDWQVTQANHKKYTIQARCYNDGFAYRIIYPTQGIHSIEMEVAEWRLPLNSKVWFAERNSDWKLKTYAGEWMCCKSEELYKISQQGPIQTMPLVYETPNNLYLMVAEAALYNYSGMRLEADSLGCLKGNFTEKDGFKLRDTIQTPWRVLCVTKSLNQLVNTNLFTNLNPQANKQLFSDMSWIKPGRSLWSWWSCIDGKFMTETGEKMVIDMAQKMGYEYSTLDEGWEKWPNKWQQLKMMSKYAEQKGVGLFVWKHWKEINDTAQNYRQMDEFMRQVKTSGAKGMKIDFMNGEGLKQIQFTTAALKLAAKHHLLINFHGCQKPSGEMRTYPNELTREGVRGLELNRITAFIQIKKRKDNPHWQPAKYVPGNEQQFIPASHNTILPFTRCVLGATDYTPIGFSMPGEVTPAHQLATSILIHSSLMTVAENPLYLENHNELSEAVKFLKILPTYWDETQVFEESKIGEKAYFARRNQNDWFIGMITVFEQKEELKLDFLPEGNYEISLWEDDKKGGIKCRTFQVKNTDILQIDLKRNGGVVAHLKPII